MFTNLSGVPVERIIAKDLFSAAFVSTLSSEASQIAEKVKAQLEKEAIEFKREEEIHSKVSNIGMNLVFGLAFLPFPAVSHHAPGFYHIAYPFGKLTIKKKKQKTQRCHFFINVHTCTV